MWGEPAYDACQRFWLDAQRARRRGGNPPAPAFPQRGKRERGSSDFLAAAGSSRSRTANAGHPAGLLCARSSSTFLSIPIPQPICRSRSFRFPEVLLRHPLLCRASIRTLIGPHWARCKLGSDLKPRSITTVTDLGCWGAAIYSAISGGSARNTQSPEQGGGCLCFTKTSLEVCWPPRYQLMLALPPPLASRMRLLGMALPWWPASGPWPARLLPLSARPGVATLLR